MVLHRNGDMAEMKAVVAGTKALTGRALRRAEAALANGSPRYPSPSTIAEARARFDAAFEGRWSA